MRSRLCLLATFVVLAGYASPGFSASPQAEPPARPSVTLVPDTAGASNVEWRVQIVVPYCGGFRIGRYVLLRFESPFTLPRRVPSQAVSFDDGPATVIRTENGLQIAPAPGRMWSMLCGVTRPLGIVLSKAVGLSNPPKPGTFAVQVSTEADPKPVLVPVVVRAAP